MGGFLMRGIFIGLLFGAPAGAVGAMTAQRTLNYGIKAGLLSGLGSSIADCFYACIGVFGLTFISDFLLKHQAAIYLVGGCLILGMGIRLLKDKRGGEIQNTCGMAAFLKKRAKSDYLHSINRLFGMVLILLGAAVLFRSFMG